MTCWVCCIGGGKVPQEDSLTSRGWKKLNVAQHSRTHSVFSWRHKEMLRWIPWRMLDRQRVQYLENLWASIFFAMRLNDNQGDTSTNPAAVKTLFFFSFVSFFEEQPGGVKKVHPVAPRKHRHIRVHHISPPIPCLDKALDKLQRRLTPLAPPPQRADAEECSARGCDDVPPQLSFPARRLRLTLIGRGNLNLFRVQEVASLWRH